MRFLLIAAAGGVALLSACSDSEDKGRGEAAADADAARPVMAAFNLSEAQLLDADLIDAGGARLGEVEAVLKNSRGQVDRLLVKVEGPEPARFVEVPLQGLTARGSGDATNLVTTMAAADLEALPASTLPPG